MIVASAVSHWRVEGERVRETEVENGGTATGDVVRASEKVEQTWQMEERRYKRL